MIFKNFLLDPGILASTSLQAQKHLTSRNESLTEDDPSTYKRIKYLQRIETLQGEFNKETKNIGFFILYFFI